MKILYFSKGIVIIRKRAGILVSWDSRYPESPDGLRHVWCARPEGARVLFNSLINCLQK
jgi:hypothetical protein